MRYEVTTATGKRFAVQTQSGRQVRFPQTGRFTTNSRAVADEWAELLNAAEGWQRNA